MKIELRHLWRIAKSTPYGVKHFDSFIYNGTITHLGAPRPECGLVVKGNPARSSSRQRRDCSCIGKQVDHASMLPKRRVTYLGLVAREWESENADVGIPNVIERCQQFVHNAALTSQSIRWTLNYPLPCGKPLFLVGAAQGMRVEFGCDRSDTVRLGYGPHRGANIQKPNYGFLCP
jgi:hypothetical protein